MIGLRVMQVLGDFTLNVAAELPGGVTAIFGPSGAGKTTLIHAVAGLSRPEEARITLGDRVLHESGARIWLPPEARRIGYVFQDARLFPHMNVARNLRYGAKGRPLDAGIVDMLDIGGLLERRPTHLSGGERQRVAIGRALMSRPDLLLMDEPLAALDAARKQEIMPYLARLRDVAQVPILYVSHALSEVAQLANTLLVLRGGRVVAQGSIDEVLSDPAMVPELGVRDAGAILTGRVMVQHDDGLAEVSVPGGVVFVPVPGAAVGERLRIRLEAQDVILSRQVPVGLSALNVLKGRVSGLHSGDGPGVMVQIDLGDARILSRITQRSAKALDLQLGQDIHAVAKTVGVAPRDIGAVGNG